jgi:uncharacterized protein (DUF433 family)
MKPDEADVLGRGVYSFAEAARLTGLAPQRVRSWFRRPTRLGRTAFSADFDGAPFNLSFLDLVDVVVAGRLREEGVSLQSLRKVYDQIQDELAQKHAFAVVELFTDGRSIFRRAVTKIGEEHLEDLVTRQQAFPKVVLPFLRKLNYDPATRLANRWNIADAVVVDPSLNFGSPTVVAGGVRTEILAAAFRANDADAAKVAAWYELTTRDVEAAVAFEAQLHSGRQKAA